MISVHARDGSARARWQRRLSPAAVGLALALVASASPAAAATPGPWAWGSDSAGQLGDDATLANKVYPATMSGLTTQPGVRIVAVAAGGAHSLALDDRNNSDASDDRVWAWGSDSDGQLGDGSDPANDPGYESTPVLVRVSPANTLTNVRAIAAGESHSVVLKHDGTVWAWGIGGSTGDGTSCDEATGQNCAKHYAGQVKGVGGIGFLTDVKQVAAGAGFTLAVRNDGTAVGWGGNSVGELGNGTTVNSTTPTAAAVGVIGLIKQVAAGSHGLAITDNSTPGVDADDKVWAWGTNLRGQLGFAADQDPHPFPKVVNNGLLDGVTEIVATAIGGHSLAVKTGKVWGWGANFAGQLGRGTRDASEGCLCRPDAAKVLTSAQPSTELSDVVDIAGGYFHSLAVKSDGTAWAWGSNADGQLGNGKDGSGSTTRDPTLCDDFICSALAKPVQQDATTNLTGVRTSGGGAAGGGSHSLAALPSP
ncbi:MAG: hypothetical protein M3Q48_10245 [Actinomycetota bacterium]|nr:hypothetical protein [Actinomycetota bacterium]